MKVFCVAPPVFKEDERCLQVALPVAAFLQMCTKPVTTRATIATHAGCVWHGLSTPFLRHSSVPAAKD